MSKRPSRRAARAASSIKRAITESLEKRVMLSGSHDVALLGALASSLQSGAASGLSGFDSRLKDATELGRSLPLIGSGLGSFDPGAQLNSILSRVSSGYTQLSQLASAVEGAVGAADGAVVSATRDLPDDLELDLGFSVSSTNTIPISANFGSSFTASGSVTLKTTLSENLTVGAYWDATNSVPVFYVSANGTNIQVGTTVTAATMNAKASLGFIDLNISGVSAVFSPTFTFSLTDPDPSNGAGRITAAELISTPLPQLVSATLGQAAPTSLTATISTSLVPTATSVTFTWADINDPTNVTSNLNTDSALASLKNLENISPATITLGIDTLVNAMSAAATNSAVSSVLSHKLPLINESINDIVNFPQFFKTYLTSFTDATVDPSSGLTTEPFSTSNALTLLLQSIPHVGSANVNSHTSGSQLIYTINIPETITASYPLALGVGSALNINVNGNINVSVAIDVNFSFGVDASTGTFFVVAPTQPVITANATLSAAINGSATLGFLGINVSNGTVSTSAATSVSLVDPMLDNPATPGIITASEMSSNNLPSISSLVNVSLTGSAAASLPISSTVPGINPVTLSLSWPDVNDASTFTFNTPALSQFLDFNQLSFDSVLGYLKQLPTMLTNIAGPSGIGKNIAFLGSSLGTVMNTASVISNDLTYIQTHNTINSVQDLQSALSAALGGSQLFGLNVNNSELDFTLKVNSNYQGSAGWSVGTSLGGGLLSLQASGQVPINAAFSGQLQFGLNLSPDLNGSTPIGNPTDRFFIVTGSPSNSSTGSSISASLNLQAHNLNATATIAFAQIGIANGTIDIGAKPASGQNFDPNSSAKISAVIGTGTPGSKLTLTDILANPTDLFGPLTFNGAVQGNLPLTGLPSGAGTSPMLAIAWSDMSDLSTISITPNFDLSSLNPFANFDASNFFSGINSVIALVQQWDSSSPIFKTNIPFINKPISSIIDGAAEITNILGKIETAASSTHTPSDLEAAVLASPAAAGFSSAIAQIQTVANNDNPANATFDYILQFHHTIANVQFPFDWGNSLFSLNGNINVSAGFTTNIEFGFNKTDGFYVVGNNDAAHPQISLTGSVTGAFDKIGGMFGPLQYGVSNGSAGLSYAIGANLSESSTNGAKIPGTDILTNALNVFHPVFSGSGNINLPIAFRLGSGTFGAAATTTFSASWDPNRNNPLGFGANDSSDPTDGFSAVNYDIGEFVNDIINPILSKIKQYNPITSQMQDVLNYNVPLINETVGQVLGSYYNNPGLKLLLQIDNVISQEPTAPASNVDISNYFQPGVQPVGGDTGGPGGAPTSNPADGNSGIFKGFQQTLQNNFYLKVPLLANPASTIISILTGKDVDLVQFDPGLVSISQTFQTAALTIPLASLGVVDVSAFISGGLTATLFANIDLGLSTRGLLAHNISKTVSVLDGFYVDDTAQYQAGVSLDVNLTVGGEVNIFGYSAVQLYGQVHATGTVGVHINDLAYNKSTGLPTGIANYNGSGAGDNRAYLDEIAYIASNFGPLCAIMPEGSLGLTVDVGAQVNLLFTSITLFTFSYSIPIANYNYPCVPQLAAIATVQGSSLVMGADPGTTGKTISASLLSDTNGNPAGVHLVESNQGNILYQDFTLAQLANVNTLVMNGTAGNDVFSFDPAITKQTPIKFLAINTGQGNDIADITNVTAANSTLMGTSITGGDGNDTIKGSYAMDTITLGNGVNSVFVGTAAALVIEHAGTDHVNGGNGNVTVNGGSGQENILLGDGNNIINAGSGSDTIGLGNGNNQVFAGGGAEQITLGDGKNLVTAGSGTDTIQVGNGDNKIFGDNGGSSITVGSGQDIIFGGSGNDSIVAGGGNDFINPGAGTNTVNGGTGNTLLEISANANQVLTTGSVAVTGQGTTTFTNIASVALTGGAGNNTFTVSGWTGGPVQITGGGGTDTVISTSDTDAVLGNSSLTRSDGTKFSLAGISAASLTGGPSDNSFDLTYWSGTATLNGGGGIDKLVAGNITSGTLSDGILARAGSGNATLIGITRAQLSTSTSSNASIDATNFSGAVALFGVGSRNTLTGGTGSDYIVGGPGNDTLVGKGTVDNQIIGGAGSSDIITGGPGTNLLVGSVGGHDTITVAGNSNRVYTPGGNDTVHAETGHTIVFAGGTGDNVLTGSSTTDQIVHPGDVGTVASDFVAPAEDIWEFPVVPTTGASTLPTGGDSQGQWAEDGSSASSGGISNSLGSAIEPATVSTGTGASAATYVAWADNRSGAYEIFVAEHVNGQWKELAGSAHGLGISGGTFGGRQPAITLDSNGNPIVAWLVSGVIYVAHYDPSANSGAGGWLAYGSSLTGAGAGGGLSATSPKIVNTTTGPVIAWIDMSSGTPNVYVAKFDGTNWNRIDNGNSTGLSAASSPVLALSLATNGTKLAAAWTQTVGTSTVIRLAEYNGTTWSGVDGSFSGNGLSGTPAASMPSVVYFNNVLYVAYVVVIGGTTNVQVATPGASAWGLVTVDTPISAGASQVSRGAASAPQLATSGSNMDLVWIEDRLNTTPDQAVAIYANRFVAGSFVRQLPGDASFDGILRRSTSLSSATALSLAMDSAGHPFAVWGDTSSGSSQIYGLSDTLDVTKIIYVNDSLTANDSYTTAAGSSSNNGLSPSTPLDTLQAALNLTGLGAGTVILVDSGAYSSNVIVSSGDNGVMILGSAGAPTTISGTFTLNTVQNVTIEGLLLSAGATVNSGNHIELVDDTGGTPVQIAAGTGGTITLNNTTNVTLEHDSMAGLVLNGTTTTSILNNTVTGAGLSVTASATGMLISGNTLAKLTLGATAAGSISNNNIVGGGLSITQAFTGPIQNNLIHGANIGVTYSAAALLINNRIYNNKTGVTATVSSPTIGFGFVAGSLPNQIINNGIGVTLTGSMQGQHIAFNTVGVNGTGTLGGTSLATASLIEANNVGAQFSGTVQYTRFTRNLQSMTVQTGQLIDHDEFYNNTNFNLETRGATDVRIINDTFFETTGNNVQIDSGSSNVQVLNNIMWTAAGYDLFVDSLSMTGFYSDYNDLFSSGIGKIVHYQLDFTDILDWQDDVNLFDLHSIGTEAVNPGGAQPRFVDFSLNDFRVLTAAAGVRSTSPTIGTGNPAIDLGLPASYVNLLTNPSFESGLTGWTASGGSGTLSAGAFDGSQYYTSGSVASGSVSQTVTLPGGANQVVSFGGRIQSAAEGIADQGTLTLKFLDTNHNPIGTADVLSASNVNGRWELVGDRVHVPTGAVYAVYTFSTIRQSGTTDDSYLDGAFLYALTDNVAGSMGGYGNTPGELATVTGQHIELKSPDLYVNWELNKPHQIVWSTFGNDANAPVQIDLYQNGSLFQNIIASTADTGSYTWIPGSGLTAGMKGLQIRVSIAGTPAVSDISSETFAIPEAGTNFYINDRSTTGDEYSTAAGSNRATGKTPGSALPLLTTLLREYSLDATSTVHVDSGTYSHFVPVELSGNPAIGSGQGVTIIGAVNHPTIITAIGFTSPAIFDINAGSFVTISNLSVSGGNYGFWVRNGSTNFNGSNLSVTGNSAGGIRLEADAINSSLDHITASGNGGDGVYVGAPILKLTNSTAFNNSGAGFDITNAGSIVVTGNVGYNNRDGLDIQQTTSSASAMVGTTTYAGGLGNLFYNNAVFGINATSNGVGGLTVAGNTVYGQTQTNDAGINIYGGTVAIGNISFNNYDGIRASSGTVLNNRVYGNSDTGIEADSGASAIGNTSFNNSTGIKMISGNSAVVRNNVVYNNSQQGIWLQGGVGPQLDNNTVYQPTGSAMRVEAYVFAGVSNVTIENNILYAQGSAIALVISQVAESGLHTNFNDLYATGGGLVGTWENVNRSSLQSWQFATGQDGNSISVDPLFVNVAGGDFHEKSITGSYHGGSFAPVFGGSNLPVAATSTLTADASESPTIDRGDGTFDFSQEPVPNGGFINMGAFGNTNQASQSITSYVQVLQPQAGGTVVEGQPTTINWRSQDTTGTVNIDLLVQGNNTPVLSIASGVANSGTFNWSVPTSLTPGATYIIRVTRNSNVANGSTGLFTISAQTHIYYVNDGTVQAGDLTTAPGNDTNSGLDAAHPKASVQGVLSAYAVGAGDIIKVDRGIYNLTTNIVIAAANAGVTIQGYTSSTQASQWASTVVAAGPAQYYRLNDSSGTIAADSSGNGANATYVGGPALGQSGAFGIGDTSAGFNGGQYVQLPGGQSNFSSGFTFETWAYPTANAFYAPLFDMASGAGTANEVVFRRTGTGNDLTLSGSYGDVNAPGVLQTNVWQYLAVTISGSGAVTIYDNGVQVGSGTIPVPTNIARNGYIGHAISSNLSNFVGQLQEAAFFNRVETAAEIQSRYLLTATRPVFARGNTTGGADVFDVQANNVTLDHVGITTADIGVNVSGNVTGLTVSNSDISNTVDGGVVLNSGDNGAVIHNNSIHGVSAFFRGGIYLTSSNATISGNTIFNCVYAGITGNTGSNSLITGNTLFNDNIGINLDTVTITQNIVYGNSDYGINAAVGTNVTGNTVFNNNGGAHGAGILLQQGTANGNVVYGNGWGILAANQLGTANNNLVYGNTNGGIEVDNATNFNGNVVYGNSGYGVFFNISPFGVGGGSLTNTLIYGNVAGGISIGNAIGFLVQNNTVYQTTGDAVNITGASSGLVLRDNILWATSGADERIAAAAQPAVSGDYNDLYATGTGIVGNSNGVNYAALTDWISATGLDTHSISADPQFVNIAGADFHEKSLYGSFHGGSLAPALSGTTGLPVAVTATLTTDANQSPVIDAGSPTDAFNLEPAPNGGYDNIGAYGNTAQASLSATQYLNVLIPAAGQIFATGQTYAVQWRTQDHAGTVEIDLMDSQNHLVTVISAAAANSGSFNWLVPTALSSGSYTIKITRSDGAGTGTGPAFTISGSTGIYYVNDSTVVAGDWTTAPGNNNNSGLDAAHPKASIQGILSAYQLSPGNIIMVDDGTYSLTANVTLPVADSGIIIEGFTPILPILNRGNINAGAYAFGITGATNVTIQNFEIINSYAAVVAGDNTASTGLTVRGLNVHLFYQVGIYIGPGNNGAKLDSNSIHDGSSAGVGYYGIQATNSQVSITNNTIFNCALYGIYQQTGDNSTISGNTIYGASTGIISDTSTITGNIIHDNANSGVNVYQSTITGNTIYNNAGGGNQAGILMQTSTASNNTVYGNVNGINAETSAFAINNRVYNNSEYGIMTQYGTATGNDVYSNGGGIYANGVVVLTNNLIYGNTNFGVEVTQAYTASVTLNTIYQPIGDAVQMSGIYYIIPTSLAFNDNIIWVASGRVFSVDDSQVAAFSSNFNDIYVTGTGEVANMGGQNFATLSAWTTELGFDANSISTDPLFVSVAGSDGLVGFSGGVDHGVDDNFRVQGGSPTIDAADPSLSFSSEPLPNGGRVNLGYTGATAQATLSAAQSIQVISPTGQRLQDGQTSTITWNSSGISDPNSNGAYTSTIQSQHPTVYLKFDETSGTTAADSSGNGLNGTYNNGPAIGQTSVFGPGNGSAVAFDGGSDSVTVSSSALNLKNTVTMSAWIKPTSLAPTWQPIFYKGGGTYPQRTYTVFLNTAGFILLSSWDGGAERAMVTPNGVVQAGVWTHIAVVMDRVNGTAAIYINGVLSATAAAGVFPKTPAVDSVAQPLYIGYSPEDPSFRYTGEIDEAAVFPTALTAADISAEYTATKGTVHIDLVDSTNAVVQSIATGVHGSTYSNWTVPASLAEGTYRVRVTSDLTGAVTGFSQPFQIITSGHDYYVNDGSLTGDTTDTAVGNNANDGKSPNTPMFSIEAVINTYHPGPGDTIHVENGNYTLYHNVNLYAADSGLTIQGPTAAGTAAVLTRASTADYLFAFGDGTHNVTFDHLSMTGADTAIYGGDQTTGVTNITISNDSIYGNPDQGIYVGGNDTGWVITGNLIHDNNGNAGIRLVNGSATITNNSIYNENQYGIFIQGLSTSASVISGNNVFANAYGIYGYSNTTVTGNLIHDNTTAGMYVQTGVLAVGNTVWRQTASGATGIELSGAEARGNIIYGNYNGVWMRGQDTVDDNRIYSNTNLGIFAQGGNGLIFNNLIYDNSNGGLYVNSTYAPLTIANNTIYQPVNDAINISASTGDVVRNNILWVEAGYDLDIAANSQSGFVSDYNDLHHGAGANARTGFWNGAADTQLSDWNTSSGMDTHSVSGDPLFVSISGADSVQGYNPTANNGNGYDGGADDNFFLSANSPAIATGLAAAAPSTDLLGQTRTSPPDMGAYAFTGTNSDTTPPTIVGTTPASVNNSGSVMNLASVTINFSEPVNPIDALAVSVYDLRSAGPDGVFNTTDDVVYALTPTYTPGSTSVTLNFTGGALPAGNYRLRVFGGGSATIHDRSGNALAATYSRQFSVTVAAPVTISSPAQYIRMDADGLNIDVYNNAAGTGTPAQQILKSSASSLIINQSAGSLPFVVDMSAGNPIPGGGLAFTGNGSGFTIIGSATLSDSIVYGSSTMTVDGINITLTSAGTVRFQPGTGSDSITVNSGALDLAATTGSTITVANFSNISVAAGATFKVESPAVQSGRYLLAINSLSIAGASGAWTGRLDLGSNDLDLPGATLSTVLNQISSGFNGGSFNGTGIDSTTLAGDSSHLHAFGAIVNNDGSGHTIYGSATPLGKFDTTSPGSSDVLVKYTYFGDANLDGAVDGSDYTRIDANVSSNLSGWFNGDFNGDHVINGSDYTLIDNAFNRQGAKIAAMLAATTASQVAPSAPAARTAIFNISNPITVASDDDWIDPIATRKHKQRPPGIFGEVPAVVR